MKERKHPTVGKKPDCFSGNKQSEAYDIHCPLLECRFAHIRKERQKANDRAGPGECHRRPWGHSRGTLCQKKLIEGKPRRFLRSKHISTARHRKLKLWWWPTTSNRRRRWRRGPKRWSWQRPSGEPSMVNQRNISLLGLKQGNPPPSLCSFPSSAVGPLVWDCATTNPTKKLENELGGFWLNPCDCSTCTESLPHSRKNQVCIYPFPLFLSIELTLNSQSLAFALTKGPLM